MASFLEYIDLYLTRECGRFYVEHPGEVYWTFSELCVCVLGGGLLEHSGMLTSEETANPFTLYLLITRHKFVVPSPIK
jgi:hypothetical protein